MFKKTILVVLILGFAGMAKAHIVELNLFDLGCPTEFNFDSSYWQTDFDLGVEFVEISTVYMDWSGEIRGQEIMYGGPIDSQFVATLYELEPHNYFGRAYVQAGADTYPDPEPFELQSVFTNDDWSALLDGKARIEIWFGDTIHLFSLVSLSVPRGELDSVILVVGGTVIPEPATLLLLTMGLVWVRVSKCRD
jgi:hypothetical protein